MVQMRRLSMPVGAVGPSIAYARGQGRAASAAASKHSRRTSRASSKLRGQEEGLVFAMLMCGIGGFGFGRGVVVMVWRGKADLNGKRLSEAAYLR
jgi:hypothetical protein